MILQIWIRGHAALGAGQGARRDDDQVVHHTEHDAGVWGILTLFGVVNQNSLNILFGRVFQYFSVI